MAKLNFELLFEVTLALEARETDLLEVGPRSRLLLVDFNVAVRSIAGFFR